MSSDKTLLAIGLIVLFAHTTFLPFHISNSHEFNQQSAGLIVPLYAYPTDPSWTNLILEKQAFPGVPIITIVNAYNGPGSTIDNNFIKGIGELKAAHITVIGYVWTSDGGRSVSDVESDMMKWMVWYNVNGIFFDTMSSYASTASYYETLAKFAMSKGFVLTVGNAGSPVDQILVGIFQVTCIYENSGIPSVSILTKDSGSRNEFAYIAYGVSNLPSNLMTQYVSWLWITNLNPPAELYMSLPPFLSQELSLLSWVQ